MGTENGDATQISAAITAMNTMFFTVKNLFVLTAAVPLELIVSFIVNYLLFFGFTIEPC